MYYTYVQTLLYYMRSFNFYIHNVHKDFSFNEEKNVDNLALSLSIKKKKKLQILMRGINLFYKS